MPSLGQILGAIERRKKRREEKGGNRISSKFKGKLRRMIYKCRGKIGQILAH